MNILATIFCYNRPNILEYNLSTIYNNDLQPDELLIIDDNSNKETAHVIDCFLTLAKNATLIRKSTNRGATHSGQIALAAARMLNPKYLFFIEADYIFKPKAFSTAIDILENTEEGKNCIGIVGYDHPLFRVPHVTENIFGPCMKAQIGEDNVNRAILHKTVSTHGTNQIQFVSNTCPTSYLKWHKIMEVAEEFPELHRYLDAAMDPQENPNYKDSGTYKKNRQIDDGMLSHAISLCWNKWAIKHGIDREKNCAWLNIVPSIANNITGGGINSKYGEMETDGGSPSW